MDSTGSMAREMVIEFPETSDDQHVRVVMWLMPEYFPGLCNALLALPIGQYVTCAKTRKIRNFSVRPKILALASAGRKPEERPSEHRGNYSLIRGMWSTAKIRFFRHYSERPNN